MKNYQINKPLRITHDNIYTIFLTLVIAFAILWILYIGIPYNSYRLYLTNNN